MNNIANLPDMLGWHIGNPLGLGSIAMLLIILVLVETMSVFDYFIRHRDKPQFYPVLYSLFGVSLLAVFYYAFQADQPTINNDVKCIGWFLYISKVGIEWAILGFVLAIHVCYGLLNAMMQITAQLSVEGNLIEGKPWKEWKGGLAVLFLGLAVSGITYAFNTTVAGWALVCTVAAIAIYCIVKVVFDVRRGGNFWFCLLLSVAFFLGAIAVTIIVTEVLHACVYLVIFLAAYLAQAKARKKKPATNKK